jgi:hypothetical protein
MSVSTFGRASPVVLLVINGVEGGDAEESGFDVCCMGVRVQEGGSNGKHTKYAQKRVLM